MRRFRTLSILLTLFKQNFTHKTDNHACPWWNEPLPDTVKLADGGKGNVKGEVLTGVGLRQATYRAKWGSVRIIWGEFFHPRI